ncbi:MAG: TlpA family protein disulfide reductase [Acidobacteria bacterium]|nr:MAG: TlpA family protein disulfide reductase [Acidobacteriota bacterium]
MPRSGDPIAPPRRRAAPARDYRMAAGRRPAARRAKIAAFEAWRRQPGAGLRGRRKRRRAEETDVTGSRLVRRTVPAGLALALGAALLLSGCTATAEKTCEPRDLLRAGEKAPPLEVKDASGGRVVVNDLIAGKVALVDVWATWCAPCLAALPHLEAMDRKYGDRGFEVVGIMIDSNAMSIGPSFVAQRDVGYQVLYDDDAAEFSCAWGDVIGIPTLLLIDRDGTVADVFTGVNDLEAIERRVQELLGGPEGPAEEPRA